jgi:hypothetical protein
MYVGQAPAIGSSVEDAPKHAAIEVGMKSGLQQSNVSCTMTLLMQGEQTVPCRQRKIRRQPSAKEYGVRRTGRLA